MTIVIYKCEHIPCNRSCNQFVLDNILRQVHGIPITLNAITLNSFKSVLHIILHKHKIKHQPNLGRLKYLVTTYQKHSCHIF